MPVFPNSPSFTLINATIPDSATGDIASGEVRRYDVESGNGMIEDIRPSSSAPVSGPAYDLDSGIVMPCFVDIHTHLDKGHIWARKENPHVTWMGALLAVIEDREALWVAEDVERRM